jgi:hypothetical protein
LAKEKMFLQHIFWSKSQSAGTVHSDIQNPRERSFAPETAMPLC